MFSDPQSVTISGTAVSMPRTGTSDDASRYASSDRSTKLEISHTYRKRARHVARLSRDTLVASPLISGQNISQGMTVTITVDTPIGYDSAAAKAAVDGFLANFTATNAGNVTKLIGGES